MIAPDLATSCHLLQLRLLDMARTQATWTRQMREHKRWARIWYKRGHHVHRESCLAGAEKVRQDRARLRVFLRYLQLAYAFCLGVPYDRQEGDCRDSISPLVLTELILAPAARDLKEAADWVKPLWAVNDPRLVEMKYDVKAWVSGNARTFG